MALLVTANAQKVLAHFLQTLLDALRQTSYRRLEPGTAYDAHLKALCSNLNLQGNDINDAFLAALALEYSAVLVSADQDFKRFSGLQVLDPVTTQS